MQDNRTNPAAYNRYTMNLNVGDNVVDKTGGAMGRVVGYCDRRCDQRTYRVRFFDGRGGSGWDDFTIIKIR
jgi:hypothetical protein